MYLVRIGHLSAPTLRHVKRMQPLRYMAEKADRGKVMATSDQSSVEGKYSDTLNLPQTDFPMRANAKQREPQLLYANAYKWQQVCLPA